MKARAISRGLVHFRSESLSIIVIELLKYKELGWGAVCAAPGSVTVPAGPATHPGCRTTRDFVTGAGSGLIRGAAARNGGVRVWGCGWVAGCPARRHGPGRRAALRACSAWRRRGWGAALGVWPTRREGQASSLVRRAARADCTEAVAGCERPPDAASSFRACGAGSGRWCSALRLWSG